MEDKPVMVIDDDCLIDKKFDLMLVAKVKSFGSMPNLGVVLKDEGFENVTIRHVGGFWVFMEFLDSHARDCFPKHEGLDTWFFIVQPWKTDFKVDERVLWIDVEGVPLVSMVRAHEIVGWIPDFIEEDNDSSLDSRDDVSDKSVSLNDFCSSVKGNCSIVRHSKKERDSKKGVSEEEKSKDPFRIYNLLNHNDNKSIDGTVESEDLSKPSGFSNFAVEEKVASENDEGRVESNSNSFKSQQELLEVEVANAKIKKTVWDCGRNKSPGPNGVFPKGCNPFFITLIPKLNDAKFVKDFHLISLIGCQYKIVGKILANRLSMVIGNLISKEQFAFIRVMEALHLSLVRAMEGGFFKGILVGSHDPTPISHLFYADDAVFIGEWREKNLCHLVSILQCFYLAPGLRINIHKYSIMGVGGVTNDEVYRRAQMIGCEALEIPFKYLGIMVGSNMNRLHAWDRVIKKVTARLSKWKAKTLSIGGRFTLTKSVLSSIPLYYFSLFKVPIGVLKRLESCRSNYFLCVESGSRKFKVQPDAMWVSIIKAIHRRSGSLDFGAKVVPIKVNVFAWRLALNKLLTRLNMPSRGLEIPSIVCSVCNVRAETVDHLFFSCSVASSIMAKVLGWWGFLESGISSYHSWVSWFEESLAKASLFDLIISHSYIWCNSRSKKLDWIVEQENEVESDGDDVLPKIADPDTVMEEVTGKYPDSLMVSISLKPSKRRSCFL
nr:RNA-directed DNA polymerase, eukaryota [Tanacetum cinerariifolium]